MEQVSTLASATVAQLREMDAAMQAQEDARLQRLMDHEREMQNSLISQLAAFILQASNIALTWGQTSTFSHFCVPPIIWICTTL